MAWHKTCWNRLVGRVCLALGMAWGLVLAAPAQVPPSEREEIAGLVQQLHDTNPIRRLAGVEQLGNRAEKARAQLSTITTSQVTPPPPILPVLREAGLSIAELTRDGNFAVRRAALRNLARVRAAGSVTAPIWAATLKGKDRYERATVVGAIQDYFNRADEITNSRVNVRFNGRLIAMDAFLDDLLAFMPTVPQLLNENNPEVVSGVLTALQLALLTIEKTQDALTPGEEQTDANDAAPVRVKVIALAHELEKLVPALARDLPKRDRAGQVATAGLLEDMARICDQRLESQGFTLARADNRQATALPRGRLLRGDMREDGKEAATIVLAALANATPQLAAALPHATNLVQRSILEALETIGPPAKAAVPAVIATLNDDGRFVRWCATRTLGRIGPTDESAAAVRALAERLQDDDIDVRLTACQALEAYGDKAAAATEALGALIARSDPDVQLSAVQALETIALLVRADAKPAVPGLTVALKSRNARVRQYAANILGYVGPAAVAALPALQQALDDGEVDVRLAAAQAIDKITAR